MKTQKNINRFVQLLLAASFFVLLSGWLSSGVLNSSITAYPAICSTGTEGYSCDLIPLNRSTYFVDEENQTVHVRWPGLGLPIEKYTNCAVIDRKNWTCTFNDGSGEVGFTDGIYIDFDFNSDVVYVTHLKWWLSF